MPAIDLPTCISISNGFALQTSLSVTELYIYVRVKGAVLNISVINIIKCSWLPPCVEDRCYTSFLSKLILVMF